MSPQQDQDPSRLVLEPIGIVRASSVTKVEAPRQPRAAEGSPARIELLPGRNFEHALEDLAGWKLLWVIFWFHHNPGWRPKVLPPRSTSGRKGVFATRSPHRPNPLGLSVVRLEKVEGLNVHVLDCDMLDGTPVLDLKPYVAYTDSHPDAGNGWLDERPSDPVAAYAVTLDPLAIEQAQWIETRTGLAIDERIRSTLMLGPEPHPYRRIRRIDGGMQLAVKEWRVRFSVEGRDVRVLEITTGFRKSQLASEAVDEVLRTHREYQLRWSGER
ncbi:tRNA (N6-threonylcarbamoyladenosine(37)-N6)-methyltransferase TrmO [Steroidobacter sp.]|uniref:tRNA (N6-threonylcarbamoyladenosine(37)-N6)-methyltransferase TrmO n=1 Tax=Steroidobacter sp. TaxID=1978227 RepID=UPI001A533832|nr:tRNA (N6-threonylcarbamoyladenosine(37)-N6)-methyltransferase TrmO [Steroidobacter sp.]MBL8271325.1 tRNA (N6-threonylcarbamoyladenosine(37)-N6)-methyltransferase TrmO [Steroidobacter sp.]